MLTKEVVKEYAIRRCAHLAYIEMEDKRLLSFWSNIIEAKKNPEDFIAEENENEEIGREFTNPFEYFRTNPEALKQAIQMYKDKMIDGSDPATTFIVENEDFQEVSELSRRYFALLYTNCKRADTVNGVLDGPEITNQALIEQNTQKYLNDPTVDVIFEGQITIDGLRARFDVLVRDKDGFNLYEVKGSNSVLKSQESLKLNYLYDMAFQYAVYSRAELKLNSLGFVHLNKEFTLSEAAYPPEDKDVLNLFTICDSIELKKDGVIRLKDYYDAKLYAIKGNHDVEDYIKELKDIQQMEVEPTPKCLYRCRKDGGCPLLNVCFPNMTNTDTIKLTSWGMAGGHFTKTTKLLDDGVYKIKDIDPTYVEEKYPKVSKNEPGKFKKRTVARLQIDYAKGVYNTPHHLEEKALELMIDEKYTTFPLIFFDFESFNYPVPLVMRSHPWQQICCQYSMHIVEENYDLSKHNFEKGKGGGIRHYEFLGDPLKDGYDNPSLNLIETLMKQLEDANIDWRKKHYRVVVYNQNFEKSRLADMAKEYTQYADFLMTFRECVVDLFEFFHCGYWYHRDFNGRGSLKITQPTLIKDEVIKGWYKGLPYSLDDTLNYKHGIIQNGGVALDVYKTLLRKAHSHGEMGDLYDKLRASLLAYCKIDSWGTVIIYDIICRALQDCKEDKKLDATVSNLIDEIYW